MSAHKVHAETKPCPTCGLELTTVRWSKDAPLTWLEVSCLNVTACPDCGGKLPRD